MENKNTKKQYQQMQEAAINLVASIGIERLDAMALDAPDASATIKRGFAKYLAATTGVTMQTARQHIARACRRLRDPNYRPLQNWGGERDKAGRKAFSGKFKEGDMVYLNKPEVTIHGQRGKIVNVDPNRKVGAPYEVFWQGEDYAYFFHESELSAEPLTR